jgi:DNA primase
MLGRYSTNLQMCFDSDQAGKVATRRGIGLALAQNFSVSILTIDDTECKDPADYVRKHGAKWNDVVASATPALQYYFREATASFDPASPESKKAIIASMGPLVRRLTSRVEQGHWIGQIATLLRADQSAVAADVAAVRDDIAAYEQAQEVVDAAPVTTLPPLDTTGLELLAALARMPSLASELSDVAGQLDPRVAAVVADPSMLEPSYDGEHRHLIDMAVMRASQLWQDPDEPQLKAHMASLVTHLRVRRLKSLRTEVERDIRQAETANDAPLLQELLAKYQEYSTQLNQLQLIQTPTPTT